MKSKRKAMNANISRSMPEMVVAENWICNSGSQRWFYDKH